MAAVSALALGAVGALGACDLVVAPDPAGGGETPPAAPAPDPAPPVATPDPVADPVPDPAPPEPIAPPVLPDPDPTPPAPLPETPEPSPVAPGDEVIADDPAGGDVPGDADAGDSGTGDPDVDAPADPGDADAGDADADSGGADADAGDADADAGDAADADADAGDAADADTDAVDADADADAGDTDADAGDAGDADAGDAGDADADADADSGDAAGDDSAALDPDVPFTPTFTYYPPGNLIPSTGEGTPDRTNYADMIVFPIPGHATFLNSQVHSPGGGAVGGDQCDPVNFSYPWRNNFCETRSRDRKTLNCPRSRVHQGQDIRAGTPQLCNTMRRTPAADRTQIPVVAVEDGFVSYIGTYTVDLRAEDRIYRYMHLNMRALQVARGDEVKAGDRLGYLSNDFGGTPTTLHLHLEFKQNIDGVGWTWVNPYAALVSAYARQKEGVGLEVADETAAVAGAEAAPSDDG